MYKARLINPLKQFGKLNLELILEDEAGVLPFVRQWCKFPDTVTDQQILEYTEKIIDIHVAQEQAKENATDEVKAVPKQVQLADISIDKVTVGTTVKTRETKDGGLSIESNG